MCDPRSMSAPHEGASNGRLNGSDFPTMEIWTYAYKRKNRKSSHLNAIRFDEDAGLAEALGKS
jgi:hypothetical protein